MAEKQQQQVAEPEAREDAQAVLDAAPTTSTVLVARADDESDVYRVMDEYDSVQVAEELAGLPSERLVYRFEVGGKRVSGLSYAGVAEAVRMFNEHGYGQVRVAEVTPHFREVQEADEKGEVVTYVECLAYAIDAKNGGGLWGLARQPKFETFRDPAKKPRLDKFATTKALSKAQRNAMEPLVPLLHREEIMARALNQPAKVVEIRRALGDVKAHELEPVTLDAEALGVREQVREAYRELRALAPMAIPPGRFNAKLRTAERDGTPAETLRELLAEIESQRDYIAAQEGGAA